MELQSERLTLRHYMKSDKEPLIDLLNDKEVSKWTERIPFPYLEKHADWWINNKPVNEHVYAIIKRDEKNSNYFNKFFLYKQSYVCSGWRWRKFYKNLNV